MRFFYALVILMFSLSVQAELLMECERYTVDNSRKENRAYFRFSFLPEGHVLNYEKVSGDNWFLTSPGIFKLIWVSNDGLRLVAHWVAPDYGSNEERWSPVHIVDVDFGEPGFRESSHGGFADFSEVLSSPWKTECRRLN